MRMLGSSSVLECVGLGARYNQALEAQVCGDVAGSGLRLRRAG